MGSAGPDHRPGHPPSGPHYTLIIIAVPPNNRLPDSNDSQRHTIIGPLNSQGANVDCRILLAANDFQVVDGFCLDGDARFSLPDADPDDNSSTSYQVWVALMGKPGGGMTLTTCKDTNKDGIEDECSTEQVVRVRATGKPNWSNVTKELLTVCLDTDSDGTCDTRELMFDDSTAQYLWTYDNYGNRIAQLRFYPLPEYIARCERYMGQWKYGGG